MQNPLNGVSSGQKYTNFHLPVRFNLNNSVDYQSYLTSTDKLFFLHPTNANKVFLLMNQLNKSKATGLDGIYARLIRECADLISVHICDIFDQSISQGKFPDGNLLE